MSSVEDNPASPATPIQAASDPVAEVPPTPRLSAKASHPSGEALTEAEIEAAEEEALAWARRANSCCG